MADRRDARIERAIAAMEARLHTGVTIADLAASAELSVSHFGRLFRAATGVTPAAYLRQLRMARARALLEGTSLPVAGIMVQVGIADPSHFARDFRRAHGFSPRALRRQLSGAGHPPRPVAARDRSR